MPNNNHKLIIIAFTIILFLTCDSVSNYEIIKFNSGKKKMEGELINKKRTGIWKLWYESGEIRGIGTYHNDKLNGEWVFWSKNGRVTDKGYFIDGKRHGKWIVTHYNNNEISSYEFHFKDNALVEDFLISLLRDSSLTITRGEIENSRNKPVQIIREFKVSTIKRTMDYHPSFPFMDHFSDEFTFYDSTMVEQEMIK